MKYFVAERLSENLSETPEGFLLCRNIPITRLGQLEYGPGETPLEVGPNGRVIIDRMEEDVFAPKTLASFEGKPITIDHPEDFVNPENWKELTVGVMQNIRRGTGADWDKVVCDGLISDARGISLVKSGLREVSCGYEAEYVQTGIGRGRQTEIIGNHLALVRNGRAGSSCAIHDKKGSFMSKDIKDKLKSLFGKAVDEMADEPVVDAATKSAIDKACADAVKGAMDAFEKKAKDTTSNAATVISGDSTANAAKVVSGDAIDALTKAMTDMKGALDAFGKKAADKKAKDEDEEEEEENLTGDSDEEEEEETNDSAEGIIVGDSASLIEILAPGASFGKAKDAKAKALAVAYSTKDGKKIIDTLTGGKKITMDKVDTIFIAAAELLKAKRGKDFAGTKSFDSSDLGVNTSDSAAMTPEKLNKINEDHWNKK